MSAVVAQVIAALSAFAALASLALYLYFGRRSELSAAREEALALAETRRQVIVDLQRRLDSLHQRHKQAKASCDRRVADLQAVLEKTQRQAREEAYRTQHFFSAALSDLLNDLRDDLEPAPPDVEAALARIRKLLTDDQRPAA
jgi:biopolymer transport protein ExbB/TolQ